ncbi:MAG: hypothetical protein NE330_01710 [Lentisphaeraceae bacterium]|nr:hypothetical protein [Lentisphaeraceae bacterium]
MMALAYRGFSDLYIQDLVQIIIRAAPFVLTTWAILYGIVWLIKQNKKFALLVPIYLFGILSIVPGIGAMGSFSIGHLVSQTIKVSSFLSCFASIVIPLALFISQEN